MEMTKDNGRSLEDFMKRRMDKVDKKHLSPGQRAELVNSFLFKALGLDDPKDFVQSYPLHWDIICFCQEMLNIFILQSCAETDTNEKTIAALKRINDFTYSAHYSQPKGSPMLGPSVKEHAQQWEDRMDSIVIDRPITELDYDYDGP